jgi:hypothetical protein
MDLLDNNVLIQAVRPEIRHHRVAKQWLEHSLNAGHSLRLFPTVEAGFLRVVTHPKIFTPPTPLLEAWDFLHILCSSPGVEVCPWTHSARERWGEMCRTLGLSGNDCNDAMLAATALERGLRLVTFDQSFRRFPNLRLLLLSEKT